MEQCKIQIDILKVPNEQKYCVKFTRKSGSSWLFYQNINEYINLLQQAVYLD